MVHAVSQVLPSAVGLLLAASPILALVLVLVTSRPLRISAAFLFGWAAGLVTAAGLLVAFVDLSARRGLPPTIAAIVRIVLGVTVGSLAVRSWRRPASASDAPPRWIAGMKDWSSARALTIGFALAAVHPKHLVMCAAGATAILEATTVPLEQALALVVFVAVASLGFATPIVLRAVGGRAVRRGLERAGESMTAHGKTLVTGVLAVIALVLIADGVARL